MQVNLLHLQRKTMKMLMVKATKSIGAQSIRLQCARVRCPQRASPRTLFLLLICLWTNPVGSRTGLLEEQLFLPC
jgi:hypothetical protein